MASYRTRVQALKKRVAAGEELPPARVKKLVDVLVEAEKIAIFVGVDAHTKLMNALDAALEDS